MNLSGVVYEVYEVYQKTYQVSPDVQLKNVTGPQGKLPVLISISAVKSLQVSGFMFGICIS